MAHASDVLTARLFDDSRQEDIDPFDVFEAWLAEARDSEVNDPAAAAIGTVDADGLPDVRMLLMNGWDRRGPVFYTNFESAKGKQITANPQVAVLFHWKSLRRQVRMRGPAEIVTDAEADAYFSSRPHRSKIGAHASAQSRPLESRDLLVARAAEFEAHYGEGSDVPRPAYWTGFRVLPTQFELWKDGEFRLHDRIQFKRADSDSPWRAQRLNP